VPRLRDVLQSHRWDRHDEVGLGVVPDRREEKEMAAKVHTLAQALDNAAADEVSAGVAALCV
jgi:hypothetical protein